MIVNLAGDPSLSQLPVAPNTIGGVLVGVIVGVLVRVGVLVIVGVGVAVGVAQFTVAES